MTCCTNRRSEGGAQPPDLSGTAFRGSGGILTLCRKAVNCVEEKWYDPLLDLLYPPRCPVCHGIAPKRGVICRECMPRLPVIRSRRCRICGRPVPEDEPYCGDCLRTKHAFSQGMGLYLYDDVMRESIAAFKYKRRREYGSVLGRLLFLGTRDRVDLWKPDVVIPVPLHADRLRQRGYNQAALLAGPVAEGNRLPMDEKLLLRTGRTKAMKALDAGERRENIRGAFSLAPGRTAPRRVLLIDDIFTTGATVDACAEALRAGGAREVYFLTLCTGAGSSGRL